MHCLYCQREKLNKDEQEKSLEIGKSEIIKNLKEIHKNNQNKMEALAKSETQYQEKLKMKKCKIDLEKSLIKQEENRKLESEFSNLKVQELLVENDEEKENLNEISKFLQKARMKIQNLQNRIDMLEKDANKLFTESELIEMKKIEEEEKNELKQMISEAEKNLQEKGKIQEKNKEEFKMEEKFIWINLNESEKKNLVINIIE